MADSAICAAIAANAAASSRAPMLTASKSANRYSELTTNAAPCAGSLALSASRGTRSPAGSKKGERAAYTLRDAGGGRRPGAGVGWTLVVRLEKDAQALGLAGALPPDAAGRRLRCRRPQWEDLPPTMGSGSGSFPSCSLLHGLLEGIRERAAGWAAHGSREGVGRDGARRAVEPDPAAEARALCA